MSAYVGDMTVPLREERRSGLAHVEMVTSLLQRVRRAHPTAGLWEAADRQWSWRTPRPTDELPQLFWLDAGDEPAAAAIVTAFGTSVTFAPIVLPDAAADVVAHVVERGLAHAAECGVESVELEVDRADDTLRALLADREFVATEESLVEAWLSTHERPAVAPLADGYRSSTRAASPDGAHHMTTGGRNHPDLEVRLSQTSLYRSDLDVVVHDARGDVAAYGLFWYDPTTATGLVEPMRTQDDHQRRGLARHVLTTGLDLLARAGANRIKIVYEPDNPASGHLYRSVGFEPHRHTDVLTGATRRTTGGDR